MKDPISHYARRAAMDKKTDSSQRCCPKVVLLELQ